MVALWEKPGQNLEAECQIVVVAESFGSAPEAQRPWELGCAGVQRAGGRTGKNLNKVSNRPAGSLHMSVRIDEPAL